MTFNDDNFMLQGKASKKLYEIAKDQPIFDYHCHLEPQAIYENKPYDNIVDLWLGGDHYKWRLMRANGVAEKYITGGASNEEKFQKWAETVSIAFGNALYHWSHLEMRDVFGIEEVITKDNWKELYDQMNDFIRENELSPRDLIKKSNVKYIGTTDHPLDDLEWHQKIKEDDSFDTVVAPTFRPDEAYVSHANFAGFAEALAEKTGKEIKDYASFMDAMADRIQFFAENGARASDISLDGIVYEAADKETLNAIFNKAINGEDLSEQEVVQWQTEVFVELARLYKEHNFVTLVHFGAVRNNNTPYSSEIGADSGFDSMGDQTNFANGLNAVLDRLARDGNLPKMVWFNLNPTYNTVLANTLANYQANDEGIAGKIQFGAGWWFNDTKLGMIDQMNAYADQGILAHFIGMLTDSRSFLSFQRHDYFRRILASYIGKWVDEEEIPNDEALLRPLIEGICYENAVNYFN